MLEGVEAGSDATTSVRFPKDLWHRIRTRAVARNETGMAWLSRCAEMALAKVPMTAEHVEPPARGVTGVQTTVPVPVAPTTLRGPVRGFQE